MVVGKETTKTKLCRRSRRSAFLFFLHSRLAGSPRTDRATRPIVAASGTVFSSEINDLEVNAIPVFGCEEFLEIRFRFLHPTAITEAPTRCESMDVRIYGKRRLAKTLTHDNARRLMANTGQSF